MEFTHFILHPLIFYNIYNKNDNIIWNYFNNKYNVEYQYRNVVPILFIGKEYLAGNITLEKINNCLKNYQTENYASFYLNNDKWLNHLKWYLSEDSINIFVHILVLNLFIFLTRKLIEKSKITGLYITGWLVGIILNFLLKHIILFKIQYFIYSLILINIYIQFILIKRYILGPTVRSKILKMGISQLNKIGVIFYGFVFSTLMMTIEKVNGFLVFNSLLDAQSKFSFLLIFISVHISLVILYSLFNTFLYKTNQKNNVLKNLFIALNIFITVFSQTYLILFF